MAVTSAGPIAASILVADADIVALTFALPVSVPIVVDPALSESAAESPLDAITLA